MGSTRLGSDSSAGTEMNGGQGHHMNERMRKAVRMWVDGIFYCFGSAEAVADAYLSGSISACE